MKPAPMTDEQIMAEFAKLYPRDAGILGLAKNNRDFMVEAIGARHHWAAFEAGAKMVSAARDQQWLESLNKREVITDPAEIRRVFELDETERPDPDSGFALLGGL